MFYTKDHLKNYKFDIGDHSYGCPEILYWGHISNLTIGRYCSISEQVKIVLNSEHPNYTSTYPFYSVKMSKNCRWTENIDHSYGKSKGPVKIGNDVWIGYGATILSGVTIGDGAIIGLGSVVARDVPPYSIVAGNPAKTVGKRFTEEQVGKLLKIQWWNWSEKKIRHNLELMKNVDKFIETHWKEE